MPLWSESEWCAREGGPFYSLTHILPSFSLSCRRRHSHVNGMDEGRGAGMVVRGPGA